MDRTAFLAIEELADYPNWPPSRDDLVKSFTEEEALALDLQRGGGDRSVEGHLFEELVTITCVIELASLWVLNGAEGFGGKVARQIWGPVDDIALLHPYGMETYIQAKHGNSVRWGRGPKSLREAHKRFMNLPRQGDKVMKFELAIVERCSGKTALERHAAQSKDVDIKEYVDLSLPYGIGDSREMIENLKVLSTHDDLGTLENAVIAIQGSVRALLFDKLKPSATIRSLMAACSAQAPLSFPRYEHRLEDEAELFEKLESLMPLRFLAVADVVVVSDNSGLTVRLKLGDPHAVRRFATWLSNARPQAVLSLRRAWSKHNGG